MAPGLCGFIQNNLDFAIDIGDTSQRWIDARRMVEDHGSDSDTNVSSPLPSIGFPMEGDIL